MTLGVGEKAAVTIVGEKDAVGTYIDDLLWTRSRPLQAETGVKSTVSILSPIGSQGREPNQNPGQILDQIHQQQDYVSFSIANLHLGLPANDVEQVANLRDLSLNRKKEDNISDLIYGTSQIAGRTITLVNPIAKVVPASRHKHISGALSKNINWVIVLRQRHIALISEMEPTRIGLHEREIHRRTEAGKRDWLAGTVASAKLALLDTEAVLKWV